ncbi:hypothetical protein [Deinococcus roseus]|nr:hypothetical protein [Deinococcus roseus]
MFKQVTEIDLILTETPTLDLAQKLKNYTAFPVLESYIFSKLRHEGWLDYLYALKFYDEPQIHDFPERLEYLRTAASSRPYDVFSILQNISEPTSKSIWRLLQVCQELPTDLVQSLRTKITTWVNKCSDPAAYNALETFLGEKILHLEDSHLIEFLRLYLTVKPHFSSFSNDYHTAEPRPMAGHSYIYFLHNQREILNSIQDYPLLLMDVLETCASIRSMRGNENVHYSVYFKTLTARDPIRRSYMDGVLIEELLHVFGLHKENPQKVRTLWEELAKKPAVIFRRLRLHLLTLSNTPLKDLIVQELKDPQNLLDYFVEREYQTLAEKHFSGLSRNEQFTVWDALEHGYFLGHTLKYYQDRKPNWTADDLEKDHEEWLYHQLLKLGPDLPEPWEARRAQLQEVFGPPTSAQEQEVQVEYGVESSLTLQDLREMTVPQVVDLLKGEPPRTTNRMNFRSDRIEALKQRLAEYLKEQPQLVLELMEDFKSIQGEYLFTILWFLREFEGANTSPYLEKVVLLLKRLLEEHAHTGLHANSIGMSCDILENILRKSLVPPVDVLADIGEVLVEVLQQRSLLVDSSIAEYDPHAVLTNTINNNWGKAALALVIWLETTSRNVQDRPERLSINLESAKQFLLHHLSSYRESTVLYAAVGFRLPWLLHMDAVWGEQLKHILFNRDYPSSSEAAWVTYLVWCKVYNDTFRNLSEQYQIYAKVDLAGTTPTIWSKHDSIQKDFAEHLALLLGRGLTSLNAPDGILEAFLSNSSVEALSHLSSFIGRSISNEDDIPEEVLKRFQTFWDQVLAFDWPADVLEERRNAFALQFSWWFSNNKFEEQWSLNQMMKVMPWGKLADAFVWERLISGLQAAPASWMPVLITYLRTQSIFAFQTRELHPILEGLTSTNTSNLQPLIDDLVDALFQLGQIDGFRKYHS